MRPDRTGLLPVRAGESLKKALAALDLEDSLARPQRRELLEERAAGHFVNALDAAREKQEKVKGLQEQPGQRGLLSAKKRL